MTINALRNRWNGPGGGTRRLHQTCERRHTAFMGAK